MQLKQTYLKVKRNALADEARLIKREEAKALRMSRKVKASAYARQKAAEGFQGLRQHRLMMVRREARAAHLANGFLRGTPYLAIERACRTEPDWRNVANIAYRFCDDFLHPDAALNQIKTWAAFNMPPGHGIAFDRHAETANVVPAE